MIPFLTLVPLGQAFFVSPTGDDANDGHSSAHAWRSLARVSKERLNPGDSVVLSGTLEGSLTLDAGGTADRPVVVRSAGKEPATIVAKDVNAIVARCGGLDIRDLVLKGGATEAKKGHHGVLLAAPGGARSPRVRVERLDVSGFGDAGLSVEGPKDSAAGFDGVTVTRSVFHDNQGVGLVTSDGVAYLSKGYAHRNLRVSDCEFRGNLGGSGIIVSGFDGGLVEYCRSRDNVGKGGGVGIWAWCSRRVTFRHCIASGTRTDGGDGGGFDLDGGCVECAVERCLSYDNAGPGAMHCDYPAAPRTERNAIRDSVSVDDGRKAKGDAIGYGLVTWGSGLYDCTVERNRILLTASDAQKRENGALFVTYIRSTNDPVEKQLVRGGVFRGNVVQLDGAGAAFVHNGLPQRAEGDVTFTGNAYLGSATFVEGDRRSSLDEWRKAHPKDGQVAVPKAMPDVRKLVPRDLPSLFRR